MLPLPFDLRLNFGLSAGKIQFNFPPISLLRFLFRLSIRVRIKSKLVILRAHWQTDEIIYKHRYCQPQWLRWDHFNLALLNTHNLNCCSQSARLCIQALNVQIWRIQILHFNFAGVLPINQKCVAFKRALNFGGHKPPFQFFQKKFLVFAFQQRKFLMKLCLLNLGHPLVTLSGQTEPKTSFKSEMLQVNLCESQKIWIL